MSGNADCPKQAPAAEETEDEVAETDRSDVDNGSGDNQAEISIESLQALADENWDKYVRSVAELDNVRKRSARDVEKARKFALERFSTELLAVRDSLELGLAAADQSDVAALREGSEATLKLLTATMERFGVVEVDPQGEPFDPQLHEAMSVQPTPELEPGSVLTVFQKGYSLNGRLLRPARVVVAAEAAGSEADE